MIYKKTIVLLVFLLLAASAGGVFAHEVRPAYLDLKQTGPETYDVFWKVPGRGEDLRLGLYVEFPAGTTNLSEPRASFVNSAFAERWSIKRAGGLAGGTIHIAGLSATMTDVLVRVERRDGTTQVTRLTPSAPSFAVEAAPRALEITRTYLVLGVDFLGVPLRDAASCCLYHHYPRIRGVLYFWSVGRSRSVRNTHTVTITARAAQTMSPQPSANAV